MPTGDAVEMQRMWYGEPLGEVFGHMIAVLGLNQARLAAVLGLSAPMLSQLMSGHRARIGNPTVVQRMQALQELTAQAAAGAVSAEELGDHLDRIRATTAVPGAATGSTASTGSLAVPAGGAGTVPRRPVPADVVREIQALLRAVASAAELIDVATGLAPDHPELAQFLRVYGAGRTDEAVAHYEAHQT